MGLTLPSCYPEKPSGGSTSPSCDDEPWCGEMVAPNADNDFLGQPGGTFCEAESREVGDRL